LMPEVLTKLESEVRRAEAISLSPEGEDRFC
jgi:hypothetical protein